MALTRGKNVSKKRRSLKGSKITDKEVTDEVKSESGGEDNDLSRSENEISEVDSDIEELAAESASAILSNLNASKLTTTTITTRMTVQRDHQDKSKRNTSGPKVSPQPDRKSADNEVHFFIDSKPFSGNSDEHDDERTSESDSESHEIDDDSNSETESSDGGSDEEGSSGKRGKKNKYRKQQKKSSSVSLLRAHISDEISKITRSKEEDRSELASVMDPGLQCGSYISYDLTSSTSTQQQDSLVKMLQKSRNDKLLEKSVITPDFEKKHDLPKVSYTKQKKLRKKLSSSKAGRGWYDMPAQEMSEDLRNDLRVLRMRSALDPKRFYKHSDMKTLPKFVQVGTVVDTPVDFYQARVPNKQRKQTVVDELLADADTRRFAVKTHLSTVHNS